MARDKHAYNVTSNDIHYEGNDWASTQRTPGTLTQSPTGRPDGDNNLSMSTSCHQGTQTPRILSQWCSVYRWHGHLWGKRKNFLGNVGYGPRKNGPCQCPTQPSKCSFGMTLVEFLGHIFDENGVHLSDKRVRGIQDIPIPTSVSSIRSVVGIVNYFRDFIPSLSSYLGTLNDLTKKRNFGEYGFEMTEKAISAFKLSKIRWRIIRPELSWTPTIHLFCKRMCLRGL